MIIGIGIDLIEIDRIKGLVEKNEKFTKRILTAHEYDQFVKLSENRKFEYIAGRFCAKEAVSKALGTGIGKNLSFQDIEIINGENGRPIMQVDKLKGKKIHVSITHTREYAAAQVVIEAIE